MKIAFDVDNTLVFPGGVVNQPMVDLLKLLSTTACEITVWSGGGKEYAEEWGRRLKLPKNIEYRGKPTTTGKLTLDIFGRPVEQWNGAPLFDFTIDDCEVGYGKISLLIK